MRPFGRQHPVRGLFGDPRIIDWGDVLGGDETGDGSYSFHNGVDIVAPDGTRVFPVAGGVVSWVAYDFVVVLTPDGRHFQYIRPAVGVGERVVADRAVLGRSGAACTTSI